MKKFFNHKIAAAIGICLFIGISTIVINAHDMQNFTRVRFTNQAIVINQRNPEIANVDVEHKNSSPVDNKTFRINNSSGSFNNTGLTNHGNNTNINNTSHDFKNLSKESSDNSLKIENTDANFSNKNYRTKANKYKYQNIDWSTWKSNFVNKILDDSLYLTCLDNYGVGTWFYYSFNVTDTGLIRDVTVFSFYLSEEDKKAVRDLIRSYAHKPITYFPKNSRRKTAKIKAIMLLGDTEEKSDASSFKDIEKIKIDY